MIPKWIVGVLTLVMVVGVGCRDGEDAGRGTGEEGKKKVVVKAERVQGEVRSPSLQPLDSKDVGDEAPPTDFRRPPASKDVGAQAPPTDFRRLPSSGLPDFAAVYENVVPSVVKITRYGRREAPPYRTVEAGIGTGFFFGEPGYVLTNAHVVSGGTGYAVDTHDRRRAEARLVGADPLTDLALLQVALDEPPAPLAPAPVGSVETGNWVMAIGNPLGLDFSATKGIVSALNRTDVLWDRVGYWDFIQTDAAINLGNSGGPLVDRFGRVVGVCTAIERQAQRIGFAIPHTTATLVAEHLKRYGKLRRAWLGIEIIEKEGAIRVTGVYPESPAYEAGLKPGDIIASLDGKETRDVQKLRWRIATHALEEPARFQLMRDGAKLALAVPLAPAPDRF